MTIPSVAVVILNWNGVAMMRKYLPTVIKYSEGATVYIADNASTDPCKSARKTILICFCSASFC